MYAAFRLRWCHSSHWHGGRCQRKQKKSIDQRAPQIGYEGIKSLLSLALKNYLVTGGSLSLVESYNNLEYTVLQTYLSDQVVQHRDFNLEQKINCQIPVIVIGVLNCLTGYF